MAKHADIRRLPVKRKDIPRLNTRNKKNRNILTWFNTLLILGIYMILLKEYWIKWISQ